MQVTFNLSESNRHILELLALLGPTPFEDLFKISYRLANDTFGRNAVIKLLAESLGGKPPKEPCRFEMIDFESPEYQAEQAERKTKEQARDIFDGQIEGMVFLELLKLMVEGLLPSHGPFEDADKVPFPTLPAKPSVRDYVIGLTAEGKRIAKAITEKRAIRLRTPSARRTDIFVASAFGYSDVDLLFDKALAPACRQVGYEPCRVDLSEPDSTLTSAVLKGLEAAEVIVADLTYARPSVYFEVGYAHGLGIPLVLTCRDDHFRGAKDAAKVHFDLEQYKISYWQLKKKSRFSWEEKMSPIERLSNLVNRSGSSRKPTMPNQNLEADG